MFNCIASPSCVGGVRMKYPSHFILVMGTPPDDASMSLDNTHSNFAVDQMLSHWPSSDLAEAPRCVMYMWTSLHLHIVTLPKYAPLYLVQWCLILSLCGITTASTESATVEWFRRLFSTSAQSGTMYHFQPLTVVLSYLQQAITEVRKSPPFWDAPAF